MSFEERAANRQLMREARVGLSIVGILLFIFVYIAFKRLSGAFDQPPPAILAQVENNSSANSGTVGQSNATARKAAKNKRAETDPDNYDPETSDNLQFDVPDFESPDIGAAAKRNTPNNTKREFNPKIGDATKSQSGKLPEVKESGVNVLGDSQSNQPKSEQPPVPSIQDALPKSLQNPPKSSFDPQVSGVDPTGQEQLDKSNQIKNELRSKFEHLQVPLQFSANNDTNNTDNKKQFSPIKLANGTNSTESKNKNVLAQHEQSDPKHIQLPGQLPQFSNPDQFKESGNLDRLTKLQNPKPNDINEGLPPALTNHTDTDTAKLSAPKNQSQLPPLDPKTDDAKLPPPKTDSTSSQFVLPEIEENLAKKLQTTSDPSKMAPDKVTVAARDSYWSIAQRVYGNGQYFRALHQFNADKGITELNEGMTISVPPLSVLQNKHPDLCPGSENKSNKSQRGQNQRNQDKPATSEYTTSQGETLFSISAEQLGQAARYIEIIKLNKDRLPENASHLTRPRPGLRLRMPKR